MLDLCDNLYKNSRYNYHFVIFIVHNVELTYKLFEKPSKKNLLGFLRIPLYGIGWCWDKKRRRLDGRLLFQIMSLRFIVFAFSLYHKKVSTRVCLRIRFCWNPILNHRSIRT